MMSLPVAAESSDNRRLLRLLQNLSFLIIVNDIGTHGRDFFSCLQCRQGSTTIPCCGRILTVDSLSRSAKIRNVFSVPPPCLLLRSTCLMVLILKYTKCNFCEILTDVMLDHDLEMACTKF